MKRTRRSALVLGSVGIGSALVVGDTLLAIPRTSFSRPTGEPAHATNGSDDTVSAIDVATMGVIGTTPVGAYPHGLRPSPDGNWVHVANAKGTTVSVIDTATFKSVADIDVGANPVQVGFAPDGRFAYLDTRTVVSKVATGTGPNGISFSPLAPAVPQATNG